MTEKYFITCRDQDGQLTVYAQIDDPHFAGRYQYGMVGAAFWNNRDEAVDCMAGMSAYQDIDGSLYEWKIMNEKEVSSKIPFDDPLKELFEGKSK